MAAQIEAKTSTAGHSDVQRVRKPSLVSKIEGSSDPINAAVLIPREDGVISVSDDRTVRVWLKRDTGQYWPSICHSLPSDCACLEYNPETRRLFIGMDNGTITEYVLAEDYNRMNHVRDYLAHQSRCSSVKFALTNEWILSCGRDKYFMWHCSETGRRLGGFQTGAWCTCLEYEPTSRYTFIGDYSGQITVLKISDTVFEKITVLKGHQGSVRCLAWDSENSMLFSGSFDQSVIVWDIGGQKGTAFELQGHHDKVQALQYSKSSRQLISGAEDMIMAFWDLEVNRKETPEWRESDLCEKCGVPFFWNVKSMWEQKTVGVRQHHCRKCGLAICAKCSNSKSTIPAMGYEYDVRVCESCNEVLMQEDLAPLALFYDSRHVITSLHLDEARKLLLTVGKDRVMKIWDVSSVLHVL